VIVQFTVSVALIIATIIIYQQIQFAKNRPVGYNREGLIAVYMTTPDLFGHYNTMRSDLLATNVVENMAESSSPVTSVWSNQTGYSWEGEDPATQPSFGSIGVTQDYGKTINWQIKEGRDFSKDFYDSNSIILNEAAVKLTGMKNIVGKIIRKDHKNLTVVGVIKDMVMESPYAKPIPVMFFCGGGYRSNMVMRINPRMPMREALANVAKHAGASHVQVTLEGRDALLRLSIHDDGVGGADPVRGSGLIGLRDRVQALGGSIEVNSPPGAGTAILVELPMQSG